MDRGDPGDILGGGPIGGPRMSRDQDRQPSTRWRLERSHRTVRSRFAFGTAAIAGAVLLLSLVLGSVASASTPATLGYRDFGYGGALASRATSDPEQSKLWYNDGSWWAGLFVSSGKGSGGSYFSIFRFNAGTHSWVNTTVHIDSRDHSHADYLWDGTHLYVVSSKGICDSVFDGPQPCNDAVRVYRFSYNAATTTKYSLDTGFPKTLAGGGFTGPNFTGGGSNAATIARDSVGEVWVAYTRDDPTTAGPPITGFHSNVYLAHSVDGVNWTPPARFASAPDGQLGEDNTAAVVAFDGKIGIYWTDKHASGASSAFFAVHNDGDPVGTWSTDSTITSSTNAVEDQVNLKADSTGNVYAVIKTGVTDQIRLFDRTTAGTWTQHNVSTSGNGNTRAQVVIDEQLGLAYVFSSSGGTIAGTIYVKSAPLSTLDFPTGKGAAFIASSADITIDDVTLSKQPVTATTGIIAEASDRLTFEFLHGEMTLAATDVTPPVAGTVSIDAGAAFTADTNATVAVPASDPGSGVQQVRLANSGGVDVDGVLNDAGATSLSWAPTVPWVLDAGDGSKTIFVQFHDAAGNWSVPVSDTITLDGTAPTGTISINSGDSLTNSATVNLAIPATDAGVGVVSNVTVANVGTTAAGRLTDSSAQTSAYAATLPWTLAAGADGSRSVYVQWEDSLGNWSGVSNDTITLDTTPPAAGSVSIDEGAATSSATINLTLTNPDGVPNIRIAESIAGLATATPQAYAASTQFTLAAGLDGSRTVYVEWLDDAGNPSPAANDSIILDLRNPVGTVSINGGSPGIRSLTVSLSFPNSDTDIDQISISNSSTMAGAATVGTLGVPFVGSTPWTLPGPLTNSLVKTVYVTFHDLAGNVSDPVIYTDTAKVDLTKPVMKSPVKAGYVAATSMTGNYIPLRATWPAASDTITGVASYRVWVSKDGHSYTLVGAPTGRSFTILGASGHTYRFRVYAVDGAGNASGSVYSATTRVAAYQNTSASVRYAGSWALSTSTLFYGGNARAASHKGNATALTFTGRSVAWVSLLAASRGSAHVYVDGHLISTVNLYSLTTSARRIVFSRTWSTSGTHTIRVVVLGTAGHPRVDLDAFVVLR
jgi:hypothetical protein